MHTDILYKNIFEELSIIIRNEYKFLNFTEAMNQIWEGSIKQNEALCLDWLINDKEFFGPTRINNYLEIGSYVGVSFRIINEIFNPKLSYSIDPNIPHRIFKQPRDIFNKINVKFKQKTICIDGFWVAGGTPVIQKNFFHELNIKFDIILIDASHEYHHVKQDFYEALKILNFNGTILLHDIYSWQDVNRFVKELMTDENFNTVLQPRTTKTTDGLAAIRIQKCKK